MPRLVWIAIGWIFVGLGLIGAVLPVMPTTVFLILAAFAFGRGSPRARAWLVNHRWFGPPIRRWEETGAIPRSAKMISVGAMTASFVFTLWLRLNPWLLTAEALAMAAAAAFILTRPD